MTTFAETVDQTTEDELRARGSHKWSKGGPGVIGAFVAEMDFGVAPPIEGALLDVIKRADFGYLSEQALAEMAVACAAWQRDRYGWDVDPGRIRPLPDVITGLAAAITVFSRPGSPVILPTPAYMPFLTVPGSLDRDIIQVPMAAGGGRYALDLDGIDAAFKRGGHLLILCNPSNPVGRVYGRDELAAVAEVVEANGGRVFADEIHAPLLYPGGTHVPYASLSAATAGHTITGTAASKGWNLPGLKCAHSCCPTIATRPRGRSGGHVRARRVHSRRPGCAAAYRDGGPWLDDAVAHLDGNRSFLAGLLEEHLPEVGYRPPEGTYLPGLTAGPCRGPGRSSHRATRTPRRREPGRVLPREGAGHADRRRGLR